MKYTKPGNPDPDQKYRGVHNIIYLTVYLKSLEDTELRFLCHDNISVCDWSVVVFPERGFKPVTNFKRNLTALSSWYSVYTSAIAFIVSAHRFVYVSLLICGHVVTLPRQDDNAAITNVMKKQ